MEKIDILLGAYNGARFIEEQIYSIKKQTYCNWNLIIRDDISTDNTVEKINYYSRNDPRIIYIPNSGKNLGPALNFFSLIQFGSAPYIMFCDQDDFWLPDKIAVSLNLLKFLEDKFGKKCPVLVHSDLIVGDQSLATISKSFWGYQDIDPQKGKKFSKMLVQNTITGCTVMINRALVDLHGLNFEDVLMHDWWFGLIASAFGQIGILSAPTMIYRQHGGNQIGAKKWDFSRIIRDLNSIDELPDRVRKTKKQARFFLETFKKKLGQQQKKILTGFINSHHQNIVSRALAFQKLGLWKTGLLRNIGFLIFAGYEPNPY